MTGEWHGAVFTAEIKGKLGKLLLSTRAENRRGAVLVVIFHLIIQKDQVHYVWRQLKIWIADFAHERRHRTKRDDDGLQVSYTMNTRFQRAVNYGTYQLENGSSCYDHTVFKNISKMLKRLAVPIKPHIFDPFASISIIEFLCSFKLSWTANGVHKGATMWLFHLLVKKWPPPHYIRDWHQNIRPGPNQNP